MKVIKQTEFADSNFIENGMFANAHFEATFEEFKKFIKGEGYKCYSFVDEPTIWHKEKTITFHSNGIHYLMFGVAAWRDGIGAVSTWSRFDPK